MLLRAGCGALMLGVLTVGSGCRSWRFGTQTVALTDAGQASFKVVVGTAASDRTKAAAAELTNYLGRIAGTPFELATGEGRQGLAVGAVSDFPELG
ncbi:MAG: hypothetical protein PHR35_19130, partial [Kiritimatiellae bacterium]|nr:hypothetical protein [Kiritimatiellia bacterium]